MLVQPPDAYSRLRLCRQTTRGLYSSAGTNIMTGCMPEVRKRMQTKQFKPHLTKRGKLQIVNEVDETGSDHSVKQRASIKVLELARSCVFYNFGHLGFGCRQIE